MSRKTFSQVKMTRSLANSEGLWEAHQASIVTLMTLAKIADDEEARPSDRRLAAVEWRVVWCDIDTAIGKAAREASWESRRPRAV